MDAVMLAAGFGTRLGSIARDRAKPLLDVGGRPALEWGLERALELPEVDRAVIVTNARFEDDFRRWLDGVPEAWAQRIRLVSDGVTRLEDRPGAVGDLRIGLEEAGKGAGKAGPEGGGTEAGGTADPRGAAAPRGDGWLVLSGDNVFRFSLRGLVDRLREAEAGAAAEAERGAAGLLPLAAAVVVETPVPRHEAVGRGVCRVDARGRIIRVEEKPCEPTCDRPVASIYAFGASLPRWVDRFLEEGGDPDAPGRLLEWLAGREGVSMVAWDAPGPRYDIGTPRRLARARRALGSAPHPGFPGPGDPR